MKIGSIELANNLLLAPMAGVTDKPFRQLCRRLGAGLAISEMITADTRLWNSRKSVARMNHHGEAAPRAVQIAGADPVMLAGAARMNVEYGADLIDINMGCPAKKVCNVMAGSALLQDEKLVGDILHAVVAAVDVPVTLKIRTGWDRAHVNAPQIAAIAEEAGIKMLTIHGRTRACRFNGNAEYKTIAAVKSRVSIPVIANGDINTAQKASWVLQETGADGIMLGRAAQGNPWIFREVLHYLQTGTLLAPPDNEEIADTLLEHLQGLYDLYGEYTGVRVSRKHLGWYFHNRPGTEHFRSAFNRLDSSHEQIRQIKKYFIDEKNKKIAA